MDPFLDMARSLEGFAVETGGWRPVLRIGPHADVGRLLREAREAGIGFHIFEPEWPSISDPGAYITYRPVDAGTWSVSLGNHGWHWAGYRVPENVVEAHVRAIGVVDVLEPRARREPEQSPEQSAEMARRLLALRSG